MSRPSSGRIWSAAHQPICASADWYRAYLATDRITFHRADGDIETRTEIAVVPDDAAEVRRITVTNNGGEPRDIELTSYGEVVLTSPDADRAHRAFSNLFIETEWHEWCSAVTATRRPRSATEPVAWCVHVVDAGKERVGAVTCETDRARFLGRGRSTVAGAASRIAPERRLSAALVDDRRLRRLADPFGHDRIGGRTADPPSTPRGPPLLAPPGDDGRSGHPRRVSAHVSPRPGRPDHGGGVRPGRLGVRRPTRRRIRPAPRPARCGRAAHAARHGPRAYPVRPPGARAHPGLGHATGGIIRRRCGAAAGRVPGPGTKQLADRQGSSARRAPPTGAPGPPATPEAEARRGPPLRRPATPTAFDNGFGGLTANGAYAIGVCGDRVPPAPWSNVIANRHGGFVITERGGGFTWAESSYSFRLTPWHNDLISDPVSEAIYLQDRETGALWCATPAPIRGEAPYTVRHEAGASSFEHERDGIVTHLTLGMAEDAPVKLSVLRMTNTDTRLRRLRLTTYVEWTLGRSREHTQHQVHTTFDREQHVIVARNTFDPQFSGWQAFHAITEPVTAYTGSRYAFLGRNGTTAAPAALRPGGNLGSVTGAGIDPCAALQCELELRPGETRDVIIVLGAAASEAAARQAIAAYRDVERAQKVLDRTVAGWATRLSVVTVRTPEPTFDAMLNRWALYQTLACRLWARSAFYQSGGAYGFRDQLQDVMALVYAEPGLAREHILRAASRQFLEGDVQHWWHPESGRGVRTRFSDDLVWLPYVVDHYVRTTGDADVLDLSVPFL